MKNLYKILIALSVLLMSQNTYAATCTQKNNTISLIGLDNPNGQIYAGLTGHDNQCGCNEVRFTPELTDTKTAISILLSAKMADKKVRVDLSDNTNCNTAIRVYLH